MADRVVLAYSGGLDTSVAVRWLIENEGVEVIAVAVDVGQAADRGGEDWDAIRTRALAAGAVEAVVVDARPRWPSTSACPRCRPTPTTRASTRSSPPCPGR